MKIKMEKNGPIVVMLKEKSRTKLKREDGEEEIETQVIALCRCGASKNKPFCDGSHKEARFEADKIELEITE